MPSALMAFALVLLVIEELGRGGEGQQHPWQGAILIAGAIFGAIVVGITELLSLFDALRLAPMAAAWLAATLLIFGYARRHDRLKLGWARLGSLIRAPSRNEGVLLACLGVLLLLVVAVSLVAPPNNVDSLQYHMPRVLEWVQNGNLDHFPTPYDSQDSRPYWAELAILDLRVLWGADNPASLPQIFSLVGILIAAMGITRLLGGDRKTQILAGVVAFGVPMGLLQASTQKNDIASSLWVMATAYFVVLEDRMGLTTRERWALFLSVALAILTKGTAIPFVAGFLLWYCVIGARRKGLARFIMQNAPAVLVVLLLNGPFWYRNIQTYGGPFGSSLPLLRLFPSGLSSAAGAIGAGVSTLGVSARSMDQLGGADLVAPAGLRSGGGEWAQMLVLRWIRMAAMHFVTPFHGVNEVIFRAMQTTPAVFPDAFVASLESAAWNQEMTAGNPLHVLVIAAAFGALVLLRRRPTFAALAFLALAAALGLFLISFGGCSDTVFCMRYQLSFFYLAAPVVALVIYRLAPKAVVVATVLLLLYAVPYVLFNNMRPVVGIPPWPTRIRSVFVENPDRILFAQSPGFRDEYEYVASQVRDSSCRRIGLVTDSRDLEYTVWRLLAAPQNGMRLEHLSATPQTQKYLDPDFDPCAVICTDCGKLPKGLDLPLAADFGHVRLYLRPPE
jgi:hypothetical protein